MVGPFKGLREVIVAVNIDTIASSARFASQVATLARDTGRPLPDIEAEAINALNEMIATMQTQPIRIWDAFGKWMSRSYTVDGATEYLPKLRALSEHHTLVFLPNHRSYLDPLVLRRVLEQGGLPNNYILGGINLAMWPATLIAKRSGLIFIRRNTREDPVYPAMLRLFLGFLIHDRANLEWYFEGGRTRTGKLRPPRMGVLKYLIDAYRENVDAYRDNIDTLQDTSTPASDVYLVPVSIVYDQQHEVGAISSEDGGGAKTPESLRWLVSFARAQSRRRGQAHLRFGEPLRLSDALDDAHERAGTHTSTSVVPRVAFEIAHRINDATPITPAALVTFALLDNEGRALSLAELLGVVEPLLVYIRMRQLPLTTDIDLATPDQLQGALATLQREGVVEAYAGGPEVVYSVARGRQHEAAFYRNTVAHWFVYRAIAENALLAAAADPVDDVVDASWQYALDLRDLLKFEFFFPRKRDFAERIRHEIDIARPGWQDEALDVHQVIRSLDSTSLFLSHRVIGPILEGYAVVAEYLANCDPAEPIDEDVVVADCLGIAHQDWLQHRLHSPESISRDLMQGALKLADNRGLLGVGAEELQAQRKSLATDLSRIVRRIALVRKAALAQLGDDDADFADLIQMR